jgi:hypothetical protein
MFSIFKFATFRLAKHCLVISKTIQTYSNIRKPVTEEVHVGMLSSQFIQDSCSSHIIAPIVSFTHKVNSDGTHELVPITPLADKFLNLMLSYTRISGL